TDPAMQKMGLLSPTGATCAARILGLILVIAGLRPTSPLAMQSPTPAPPNAIALLGALMIITSFTMVGHTTTNTHRAAAAALITLHLLVVAFWLGALWPLYMVAKKEQPAIAG